MTDYRIIQTETVSRSERWRIKEVDDGHAIIFLAASLSELEAKRAEKQARKAHLRGRRWPRIVLPAGAAMALGKWLRRGTGMVTGGQAAGLAGAAVIAAGGAAVIAHAALCHGLCPPAPPQQRLAAVLPAGGTVPITVGHYHPGSPASRHGDGHPAGFPSGAHRIPGPSRTGTPGAPLSGRTPGPGPTAPGAPAPPPPRAPRPGVSTPPVPGAAPPPVPGLPVPKATVPAVPLPKIPVPKLPKVTVPKLPKVTVPKVSVPAVPAPHLPKVHMPKVKAPKVKVPRAPVPAPRKGVLPHHKKALLAWVRDPDGAAIAARGAQHQRPAVKAS